MTWLSEAVVATAWLTASTSRVCQAFVTPNALPVRAPHATTTCGSGLWQRTSSSTPSNAVWCMSTTTDEIYMPPKLETIIGKLKAMENEKMKFTYLIQKAPEMERMHPFLLVPANQVMGCLSTVHVYCKLHDDDTFTFTGNSEGQLTAGLLWLLVEGLSGERLESILKVKPDVIRVAGLTQSLTPGRNSGFRNMLEKMQSLATLMAQQRANDMNGEEAESPEAEPEPETPPEPKEEKKVGPIAAAITAKLEAGLIEPLVGVQDDSGDEQKLTISVISSSFNKLPTLKRHQLVYRTIAEEMTKIHAATLITKTPMECLRTKGL